MRFTDVPASTSSAPCSLSLRRAFFPVVLVAVLTERDGIVDLARVCCTISAVVIDRDVYRYDYSSLRE